MQNQEKQILIYTHAADGDVERFTAQLTSLGYLQTCTIKNHQQVIRRLKQGTAPALILLLTGNNNDKNEVLQILQHRQDVPVLGLFSESSLLFLPPIVTACNEIETYPCRDSKLDFRLGKIVNHDIAYGNINDILVGKMKMVGNSSEFQQVIKCVHKITKCDAPVFIDGETGTGKELVARAVHYLSERRDYPFIAANCGALPDQLVENELFGHEKGAFTDASESREGLVSQAEKGTLFLDEIETLTPKGQVALLRFLENRMYRPLGSKAAKYADVRIIAATNESIPDLIQQGQFRKDLYYRINIMNILLPPLRERQGDIELLAQHFIRQFQMRYDQPDRQLHPDSLKALQYYDWPGNVRELENMLHREFLMAESNTIYLTGLESVTRERRSNCADRRMQKMFNESMASAKSHVIKNFEQQYLCSALDQAEGNISEAARIAGKERRSFTRLLEKYELDRARYK